MKVIVPAHPLPRANWPTREEAGRARWFSPVQLGPVRAATRSWVPAMVPWRATEDGFVTEDVLDWYGRFARGKPGVLVVEATGIRDIPSGPLLRIGHDRFLPGLERLVRRVREQSEGETRLFIQTIDFLSIRRRPERAKYFERFLRVTDEHRSKLGLAAEGEVRARLAALDDAALREVLSEREYEDLAFGARERVTDDKPHIQELSSVLPGLFAAAAGRAQKAGFDGVELHYAHAYTMASFLSATNTRTDGYGGPRENRIRLPLEVYRAVRSQTGKDFALGVRFLGDEVIANGNRVEDAAYFGVEFARAGFDFLSISKGGKFDDAKQPKVGASAYPYTGPSGHECMPTVRIDARGPFSRNVPLAAAVKRAVNAAGFQVPVVAAGGIATFEQAEGILVRGEADIVAAARQALADPDWVLKTRLGLGSEIRRCEFTNYCEGLDQVHKQVTCKLWDRQVTPGATLSSDGKRRLVAPPWAPPEARTGPDV